MILTRQEAIAATNSYEDELLKKAESAINQAVRGIPPTFGSKPTDEVVVEMGEPLPQRVIERLFQQALSGGWALEARQCQADAAGSLATRITLKAAEPAAEERVMIVTSVNGNIMEGVKRNVAATFGVRSKQFLDIERWHDYQMPKPPVKKGIWVVEGNRRESGTVEWREWRRALPEEVCRLAVGQEVWI